jgi:Protein of unknown function (DUF2971)
MPVPTDASSLRAMLEELPDHLYKYRALYTGREKGFLQSMLLRGEINFSLASEFNDPFDLAINPSFEGTDAQIEAYWEREYERRHPEMPAAERKRLAREFRLKCLAPGGLQSLERSHATGVSKAGVFCLCESPTSTLMWSHYAQDHYGVAVRFRVEALPLQALRPLLVWRVHYSDMLPRPNYYSDSDEDYLRAVLATKSREWSHEREWRLVRPTIPGVFALPLEAVDGVVFGLRTPEATRNEIRSWSAQRSAHPLDFFEIVRSDHSFELKIVPARPPTTA